MAPIPITPASDILHQLSTYKHFGVRTFQAEDEIAAIGSTIGASFGGALALTASSGPGIALKSEAMGLAVMVELPLVVVNVQRGGPSTGLPTKNEQSDLLQAMFGRNGDAPLPIVAPATPSECFDYAIEAMPSGAEVHDAGGVSLGRLPGHRLGAVAHPGACRPAGHLGVRNHTDSSPSSRTTVTRDPGPTLGHPRHARSGAPHRWSRESQDVSGIVSYDADNHQRMTDLRARKVAGIADDIPDLEVLGPERGDLLILGWGSTYGSLRTAAERLQRQGHAVAHAQLRHLNPFPRNTGDVLASYRKVLIPEINTGQLRLLIRGRFLVDAVGLNRVRGKPFPVTEVERAGKLLLSEDA